MKMEKQSNPTEFTSGLTKRETIAAIIFFPLHLGVLPMLALLLNRVRPMTEAEMNFLVYCMSLTYIFLFFFGFLRRDFDALADRPLRCLWQVLISYAAMMAMNMVLESILPAFTFVSNPNTSEVLNMANTESGLTFALTVFIAPLVEEPVFRGGFFSLLRKGSRFAAYAVTMLVFAIYHVWAYLFIDLSFWVYIIQYLPISFLLCRCYEKTNSIWTPIFLHMLVNGVSMGIASMM